MDTLLLHEVAEADLSDPLLEWLRIKVAKGRIGAYGTATNPKDTLAALSTPFADAVQCRTPSRAHARQDERCSASGRSYCIPSSEDIARLSESLQRRADIRADLADLAAAMTGDPDDLATAILAATAEHRPAALVLFASRKPGRVLEATEAIDKGLPSGGMTIVHQLVAEMARFPVGK